MTNQNNLRFTIEDMEREYIGRDCHYNYFCFGKGGNYLAVWEEDKTFKTKGKYDNKLTDYFEDWMNPIMTEVSLFELTTGLKYITYFLGLTE